jgi:hypothetical protein
MRGVVGVDLPSSEEQPAPNVLQALGKGQRWRWRLDACWSLLLNVCFGKCVMESLRICSVSRLVVNRVGG